MRLLLSIFVSIVAIAVTVFYQQDTLSTYMRPFLKTNTLNNISKSLKLNSNNAMSAMVPNSTFVGLPVIPPQDPSLNAASPKQRGIQAVFEAREQAEGAGATVRRSIGTAKLRNFTPFLMLDHFNIGVGAGFPDHPHRGQETITYLLEGAADHEDFAGHKGTLWAGDLQFMTAGKGIVHAEMPHDNGDGSSNNGMQLWVDLPKDLKNCEPRYRDLRAAEIPIAEADDGKVTVKVISGQSQGVDSLQQLAYTPVWLLDVTVRPGGAHRPNHFLPAGTPSPTSSKARRLGTREPRSRKFLDTTTPSSSRRVTKLSLKCRQMPRKRRGSSWWLACLWINQLCSTDHLSLRTRAKSGRR